MEIKQGIGQFCKRDPNLKSTISKNRNQAGQRPILSEGSQSEIYYFKKMEIKQGIGRFCQRDPNLKSTISKNGNQAGHCPILSEGSKYQI